MRGLECISECECARYVCEKGKGWGGKKKGVTSVFVRRDNATTGALAMEAGRPLSRILALHHTAQHNLGWGKEEGAFNSYFRIQCIHTHAIAAQLPV